MYDLRRKLSSIQVYCSLNIYRVSCACNMQSAKGHEAIQALMSTRLWTADTGYPVQILIWAWKHLLTSGARPCGLTMCPATCHRHESLAPYVVMRSIDPLGKPRNSWTTHAAGDSRWHFNRAPTSTWVSVYLRLALCSGRRLRVPLAISTMVRLSTAGCDSSGHIVKPRHEPVASRSFYFSRHYHA